VKAPFTLALVAFSAFVSFFPGAVEILEFDRGAVARGQVWRPLTGQLVHWTPRMAVLDLGVLLGLGIWLERHSRRVLLSTLVVSAALVAAGVQFIARELVYYRGSSGLATAVFMGVALVVLSDKRRSPRWRILSLLSILLLGVKILWETQHHGLVAAGSLPSGVQVVPIVHLLGAIGAVGVYSVLRSDAPHRA